MSYPEPPSQRPPVWFTIIAIITALPAIRLPFMLGDSKGEAQTLMWMYPLMLLLGAWCAWRCYSIERKTMAWILVGICWLITAGINIMTLL